MAPILDHMSGAPVVCPHCRTWFEAEGRSARCPSCGRRFDAEKARLDKSQATAPSHERLDHAPLSTNAPDAPQGWDLPTPAESRDWDVPTPTQAGPRDWDVRAQTPAGPRDRDAPAPAGAERTGTEPAYSEPDAWQQPAEAPGNDSAETPASEQAPTEEGNGRPNVGVVFTIAMIALFMVGRQFLSGELLLAAIALVIGGRWLAERWQKGGQSG